jgi:hypothetical protein
VRCGVGNDFNDLLEGVQDSLFPGFDNGDGVPAAIDPFEIEVLDSLPYLVQVVGRKTDEVWIGVHDADSATQGWQDRIGCQDHGGFGLSGTIEMQDFVLTGTIPMQD